MDGYALRSGDTESAPVSLRVVGTTHAGDEALSELPPGSAQRIMTGAPVPNGADAVCMIELSRELGPGQVEITVPLNGDENIRRAGDDVAAGELCFTRGTELTPAHLGVLVSAGVPFVRAVPRARVAVLSTGDELITDDSPLVPGKIRDSNRPTLTARLQTDGFSPVDLGSAADETSSIASAIGIGAQRADAVVTVGGVSVGDHDFLADALRKLGASSMTSLQIAIRPAKPFAFGVVGDPGVPVFGLPGNPVSALVSYELLVRPALRAMAGHRKIDRPLVTAFAPDGLPREHDGKTHFVRVRLRRLDDGTIEARPTGGQGSHQLRGLAEANALAVLPDGDGVPAGGRVDVLVLRDDGLVPESAEQWIP